MGDKCLPLFSMWSMGTLYGWVETSCTAIKHYLVFQESLLSSTNNNCLIHLTHHGHTHNIDASLIWMLFESTQMKGHLMSIQVHLKISTHINNKKTMHKDNFEVFTYHIYMHNAPPLASPSLQSLFYMRIIACILHKSFRFDVYVQWL